MGLNAVIVDRSVDDMTRFLVENGFQIESQAPEAETFLIAFGEERMLAGLSDYCSESGLRAVLAPHSRRGNSKPLAEQLIRIWVASNAAPIHSYGYVGETFARGSDKIVDRLRLTDPLLSVKTLGPELTLRLSAYPQRIFWIGPCLCDSGVARYLITSDAKHGAEVIAAIAPLIV